MDTGQKIAVVFASLSGSTQRLAEHLQQWLIDQNSELQVDLLDMLMANPDAFTQYDFIFMGVSTHGEGDLNPFAEIFVASMSGREAESIWKDVPFAVFGMGDSSYLNFCAAADTIAEFIPQHGGKVILPVLKIDALTQDWDEQQALITEWAQQFVENKV